MAKTNTTAADNSAAATNTTTTTATQLPTIEELKARKKTPEAVFDGVIAAQGWRRGKQVSEGDYDKAVAAFSSGAIGGRSKSC